MTTISRSDLADALEGLAWDAQNVTTPAEAQRMLMEYDGLRGQFQRLAEEVYAQHEASHR